MVAIEEEVHAAVRRGADAVLRRQETDGSWRSRNDAGPLFTGASLAFERALGTLRAEDAEAGVRFLRHVQLPDGSAEAWAHAGKGSLEATSFWLAGMRAADVPDADPDVSRARAYVDARGGLRANRLIVQALLAAAGLVPPSSLPRLPLVFRLVPGHDRLLAALLGVNALVPAHTLAPLVRGLQDTGSRSALRRTLDQRVVDYLTAHQDPSGSWAGVPYYTLQAALTLKVCGVPVDDPRITRALGFARAVYEHRPEGLFVGAFFSSHWDTAHMIRALGTEDTGHPALASAVRYLLAGQAKEPSPEDWQTPPPGAPLTGGWAWQPGNARNPDLDSTAEVLSALAPLVGARQDPALGRAVEDGFAWLLPFQNRDGGWGAFSHGKREPPTGPLFVTRRAPATGLAGRLRDAWHRLECALAEAGDPSTADVTGRVLYAMGKQGIGRDDPRVEAAARFLAKHQLPSGAWWARWSVCYLPATAYIVTGLRAVGERADSEMLRRALAWMLARQNADGGWGETAEAFEDPALAGIGPSSVQITGVVLWALQEAGVRGDAVDRGVRFLLDRQRPDGDWEDPYAYGVVFPHLHYYHSDAFPLYFALEALRARIA